LPQILRGNKGVAVGQQPHELLLDSGRLRGLKYSIFWRERHCI